MGYDLLDREQHLLLFQLRSSMQTILDHLTVEQSERVGWMTKRILFFNFYDWFLIPFRFR